MTTFHTILQSAPTWAILLAIIFLAAIVAWFACWILYRTTPIGEEDENGFHEKEGSTVLPTDGPKGGAK